MVVDISKNFEKKIIKFSFKLIYKQVKVTQDIVNKKLFHLFYR